MRARALRWSACAACVLAVAVSGHAQGPQLAVEHAVSGRAQGPDLTADQIARGLGNRYGDGLDISGKTRHRLVLFTFDDGPRAPYTNRLLDLLDEEGVKGVFLVVGQQLRREENAALAREIIRRGHMIGNHTMHHLRTFPAMSHEDQVQELMDAREQIVRAVGARSFLFRAPGGAHAHGIDRVVAELGYTNLNYNEGGASWRMTTTEDVVNEIMASFGRHERNQGVRGGIIAMHDTSAPHVAAFPLVLERLRRRNCELLATPGEELYDVVSDLDLFFQPREGAEPGADAAWPELTPEQLATRQARVRAEAEQWCAAHPAQPE